MPPQVINLEEKFKKFSQAWSPKIVARMNEYDLRLVKLRGDFVWHSHPDTDEAFVVLRGQLRIDFRDGAISLNPGEMTVIPKGVEHKPFADGECHVLLIEPMDTVNTGNAGGELTRAAEWI